MLTSYEAPCWPDNTSNKAAKAEKAEVGENLIWSLLYDTAYKISHFKDKIH